MDTIFFMLGSFQVSYALAASVGAGLIVLLLVVLIILSLRGNRSQIAAAAGEASEALRLNYQQLIIDRDARITSLEALVQQYNQANTQAQSTNAGLRAQMFEQNKNATETLERVEKGRQQMTAEFKLIAGEILKSHGETFSKQNREQVDLLLKPLSEKIVEFQTGLTKERATMSEQIRTLVETNQVMTTETTNLTQALKGNSQTQGAWGEMILSTILERSGLREGEQFITQQTHHTADGRLRTDVEILMPRGKRLIIDSKVSLTAFEAYTSTDDPEEKQKSLAAHVASIRSHIKTLADKDYQRHADSDVDYVMMFMPIESALAAASAAAPSLIQYGLENGVALTTPTTLMTILRTVRSVWDIEKRNQNAEEIAARAGALYEKVVGFLGNMGLLEKSLDKARQSFDAAKGQLSEGSGNVVRQIEMLRELGARTNKHLPADWTTDDTQTAIEQVPQDPDPTDEEPDRPVIDAEN